MDPLASSLRELRSCFADFAQRWDGRLIRYELDRRALLDADGDFDERRLQHLFDGLAGYDEDLAGVNNAADATSPVVRGWRLISLFSSSGAFDKTVWELAGATIRTLAAMPHLARRTGLGETDRLLPNGPAHDRWLEVLMHLGDRQVHPALIWDRQPLKLTWSDDPEMPPAVPELALPAQEQAQVQQALNSARGHLEELQCGVLLGSAFAFDWLMAQTP